MSAPTPIIKLEVQGMKHAICVALSQYAAQMDAEIQAAVERACQPEEVARVIEMAAGKAIHEAVSEEVAHFFRYGDGRGAIREAVERRLKANG